MRKKENIFIIFIVILSIVITGIFMGKDMTADDTNIVQVTFTNNEVTEDSVGIHVRAQCLDGYEIKAIQVDEQSRVENVTEFDFTATENRDYVIKVYYQSLIEQKELTETFMTTVDSIETQNDNISTLADTTDVTPTPDIVTTPDGYTFDKSTGTIIKYTEQPGVTKIDIPETIEGVVVEEIGNSVFYKCGSLIEVNMPNTITSLGSGVFADLFNLEKIHLSTSLKSIGWQSFMNCEKLSTINIPSTLTYIGDTTFGNAGLAEITFSNVNINFNEFAFTSCRKLKKVSFYNSSVSMEPSAFTGYPSLMTVNIVNSVINGGKFAFSGCIALSEVNIKNSVISTIETSAFRKNNILKVIIPVSTKTIMPNAFGWSDTLTTVYLPDSIEYIYEKSFDRCPNFQKVIVMMTDPKNINIPNNSPLLTLDNAPDITGPLEWYRIVLTGDIKVKQDTIHSIANKRKIINLENIFEDRGIQETIYQGKTGTELYAGNDIEVPEDYYGTDTSIQYQLLGTPTSHDTKIIDNQLHIGADETSNDLRLTATLLNTTTQEVPIQILPLSAIEIVKEPHSQYIEGDRYNPDGLVIKIIYSDGYEETVVYNEETKDDFTFAYHQLNTSHTKQIITYKGKTFEHQLTVVPQYQEMILEDQNINVKGCFVKDSYLVVEKLDQGNSQLISGLNDKDILGQYEARIVGDYKGKLFLTFDIGKEYDGQKVYIRQLKNDGSFEYFHGIVEDGKVSITVNELNLFVLYMDQKDEQFNYIPSIEINNDFQYSFINEKKQSKTVSTNDNVRIIGYVLLCGVSLLVIRMRKWK